MTLEYIGLAAVVVAALAATVFVMWLVYRLCGLLPAVKRLDQRIDSTRRAARVLSAQSKLHDRRITVMMELQDVADDERADMNYWIESLKSSKANKRSVIK